MIFLSFVEYFVDKRDCNRSLADRRGHALEASSAHVADGEDSGETGLEEVRGSSQRPFRGRQVLRRQVRSCLDKALIIQRKTAIEPASVRDGSRHHEDVLDTARFDSARSIITPANPLQLIARLAGFKGHDFCLRS